VQISDAHVPLRHVVGQRLSHALCQCGDQHLAAVLHRLCDFSEQMVYLPLDGMKLDFRVEQSRRTDDLLRHVVRAGKLVLGRRGGNAYQLPYSCVELPEGQRTVVKRAFHAEAVIHEIFLSRSVSVVHTAYLRQRHMAFVDKGNEILREII